MKLKTKTILAFTSSSFYHYQQNKFKTNCHAFWGNQEKTKKYVNRGKREKPMKAQKKSKERNRQASEKVNF